MSEVLSANTKAILLLTAPLVVGRGERSTDLLSPSEYRTLARHLRERNAQPADLLKPADGVIDDCGHVIEKSRLERLLGRGFLLSQAVERWQARAIWVMSRADQAYPQRLKSRLREDSPAVLYGCGDPSLLGSGGLAVVGSRHVDDETIQYTQAVGRLAASAGRTLVSGGARGVDQAAMRGALAAGGRAAGVLADSLEKTAMQRDHRDMLLDGRLVLISPYDPKVGFHVGQAMQRNKLVYALADAALVVNSDLGKGGTWAGATEQLDKLQFVPVFVRTEPGGSGGLEALMKKGALPWPEPVDADGLETAIATAASERMPSPNQGQLSFSRPRRSPTGEVREAGNAAAAATAAAIPDHSTDSTSPTAADLLFDKVRSLVLRLLRTPMKSTEVAHCLGVTGPQAKAWLTRLVDEGVLDESEQKPEHYSAR